METESRLGKLCERFHALEVERDLLKKSLATCNYNIAVSESSRSDMSEARMILSEVARLTQMRLKGYVESLATMAIKSVFPDRDWKLIMDLEFKRNHLEVTLKIQEGDQEPFIPKEELGGGVVDVLSFVLRVILWTLQVPRSRATLILDEPFRFVGRALIQRCGQMVKEISQKLGVQMIIVTHESELMEVADKAWTVVHNGTRSLVSCGVDSHIEEAPSPVRRLLKRRKLGW